MVPKRSRGFTLIELLIVIAIIIVLVMVLIFAVLPALKKGADARTTDLFGAIAEGMTKWRTGEGKADGAFPKSGVNSAADGKRYDGNMLLFKNLVGDPEKKGRTPYVEVDEDMIGYLDPDGITVRTEGKPERRVFLDGHGTPIIYWEWKSKTQQGSGDDPTEGIGSAPTSAKELALARNKGSYDLYSAGTDKLWGSGDDKGGDGSTVTDSPLKSAAPAEDKPRGPTTQ